MHRDTTFHDWEVDRFLAAEDWMALEVRHPPRDRRAALLFESCLAHRWTCTHPQRVIAAVESRLLGENDAGLIDRLFGPGEVPMRDATWRGLQLFDVQSAVGFNLVCVARSLSWQSAPSEP